MAASKGKGKGSKAAGKAGGIARWEAGASSTQALDASALGEGPLKRRLLQQVVRMYEANRRQGTHCTKTRGETNYTTRKPYAQKGTGNARRGDFNSPLLRGGGVIFGPRPRDYGFSVPRKALREALRSALAGKLADGEVVALGSKGLEQPSTKTAAAALTALGSARSALIVLPAPNDVLYRSFRNIRGVSVVPASDLNAHQVLAHRQLVLVDDAWEVLSRRLARDGGGEEAA